MKVNITKDANQQLINLLGAEPIVKINEIRTTGWGATYMYELAQVEQAQNDEIFKIDEVTILIDPLVISHLDEDIVIDHKKNYGFILKNSYEIVTFGMKLIKQWKKVPLPFCDRHTRSFV